jgi:hypothetical protein
MFVSICFCGIADVYYSVYYSLFRDGVLDMLMTKPEVTVQRVLSLG